MSDTYLQTHSHGKNRVRVLKVRRLATGHEVMELTVKVVIESHADKAFTSPDNSNVVATDSIKNTVYVVAKTHQYHTIEGFALHLVNFFLSKYPDVIYGVSVDVKEQPWKRATVSSGEHHHGFLRSGPDYRVVHAYGHANGTRKVIGGIRDLIVLKTTQTGFINFYRNEHATLPDAEDRLLATNVAATWLYSSPSGVDFHAAAAKVKSILMDTFFGNAKLGVYSYSVQQTLHDMGVAVLNNVPGIQEIKLELPNIHFLPYKHLSNLKLSFNDDIYLPTDEPHGTIHATIARGPKGPSVLNNSKL